MYNESSTSENYINPKADFEVRVVRNNNDVIIGLAFAQKKDGEIIDGSLDSVENAIKNQ